MADVNALWSAYQQVVVETYEASRKGRGKAIHVRPVEGEVYPVTMDVECSRSMRKNHPVGTRFRIYAKETNKQGSKPFLYSHFNWPYEVVRD
ncbi:hypothetical protein [uncultured Cohaesibacter sp.]|uniref:hypothetical protein n=1 Tax=uncultured Cohaesibacter sp. TaxID=1002546 RepID=UPI002AAA9044|nr:hypothetical protein [uncultured Cohaesibacter sp.]